MHVLFAAAEFSPLARVGGLAEAASGLVRALRSAGIQVEVVLPDYFGTDLDDVVTESISVPWWVGEATARRGMHPDIGPVTLVDVDGIARPHPYVDPDGQGWPDNDHRFMAFSAAVGGLIAAHRPDVVHLNDWHTAAVTGMLVDAPPTVLTIHTLGYQGVMDRAWLDHLPNSTHRFAWHDATNPLAGAIESADRVIAVSPNYAREILTEEAGMGLHSRLAGVGDRLVGIRNGIDASVWDPQTDPYIEACYGPDDLEPRAECRDALIAEAGWTDDKVPVAAMVTRLVEQKGIDIIADLVRFLPALPLRLAVLGSGDADLTSRLQQAAADYPDHLWFSNNYDNALGHRLFAGSDLFLMPSRFEPCGLGQMQAMAYGSIPVVTDVGGLRDTVIDADEHRSTGTGFVSTSVDSTGFVDALHRSVRAYTRPNRRAAIQRRGMTHDWSWSEPARHHIDIYEAALESRAGHVPAATE